MIPPSKASNARVISYARRSARKAKGRFPVSMVATFACIFIGFAIVILPALPDPLPHNSSRNRASLAMEACDTAIMAFRDNTGRLPTNAEGLSVLLSNSHHIRGWDGPYLAHSIIDPWCHPYVYQANFDGTGYVIVSLGPDGKLGTADDLIERATLSPSSTKKTYP